jgi:hypothetical protein
MSLRTNIYGNSTDFFKFAKSVENGEMRWKGI